MSRIWTLEELSSLPMFEYPPDNDLSLEALDILQRFVSTNPTHADVTKSLKDPFVFFVIRSAGDSLRKSGGRELMLKAIYSLPDYAAGPIDHVWNELGGTEWLS